MSRDAVATWRPVRRAISETCRAVSSGVNAAKIRTARAMDDSPVAARGIRSVWQPAAGLPLVH